MFLVELHIYTHLREVHILNVTEYFSFIMCNCCTLVGQTSHHVYEGYIMKQENLNVSPLENDYGRIYGTHVVKRKDLAS